MFNFNFSKKVKHPSQLPSGENQKQLKHMEQNLSAPSTWIWITCSEENSA